MRYLFGNLANVSMGRPGLIRIEWIKMTRMGTGRNEMTEASYAIRRSNLRFPFFADADLNLQNGVSVPAQVSELSARGCYVDALQPVAVGTEMRLCICYGPNTCEVNGKVIYKHSGGGMGVFGMGVLFGKMSAEQQSEINAWLHDLARNRVKTFGASQVPGAIDSDASDSRS
jgi:hypothetical protein